MNTKEHRVAALYYLHRFDHLKNVILEVWRCMWKFTILQRTLVYELASMSNVEWLAC